MASLNWSDESLPCPDEFRERSDSDIRTCGINSTSTGSCPSLIFKTYSTVYSRVCGKINAYQVGTPDAFDTTHGRGSNITIDFNYVDGVSLTHGNKPRRHIWTFAATHQDGPRPSIFRFPGSTCQCVRPGDSIIIPPPPPPPPPPPLLLLWERTTSAIQEVEVDHLLDSFTLMIPCGM